MLSSALLYAVVMGQSAGPAGAGSEPKSGEIKTMADAFAASEKVALPEYMRRIVVFTYRASTGFEASRIDTLIGPGKVRLKINDLNGLNVMMSGSPKEIWVLNPPEKAFMRVPFGENPPGTAAIHQAIFGELNKDKPATDDLGLKMKFHPSGMPSVEFAKPLNLHERKKTGEGEELIFMGEIKNFDLTAILKIDSKGRVQETSIDLVGDEGYTAHIKAESVVYSHDPIAEKEFEFPAEQAKGFKQMSTPDSGG